MTRRRFAWLVAGVALVLGLKLLIDHARLPERAAGRPDLLIVSIDTLRADHLGVYGYERPVSPTTDEFAAGAVVFENAFSQSPKTAISHMSMFTGLYPEAHGVRQWTAEGGERLSSDVPTLAQALLQNGYQTAGIGGGGHVRRELGFDRGFATWEKVGDLPRAVGRSIDLVRKMAASSAQPYFLFLHTYAVHDPYVAPARYRTSFVDAGYTGSIVGDPGELKERAGNSWANAHKYYWQQVDRSSEEDLRHLVDLYDAGIRRVDDQLSRLLETLEDDGALTNAIIVLLSDHGEEFLEHGEFLHEQVYEELLHVPLIVRFPGDRGSRLGGQRVQTVVQLVDLAPTLLDFIGLPIPKHMQGRSLRPLLEGNEPLEEIVLSSWAISKQRSLRLGDWKVVRRGGSLELYNLSEDPGENRDLSADEPAKLAELAERMRELVAASRDLRSRVREGETIVPSQETLEELRALGYIE